MEIGGRYKMFPEDPRMVFLCVPAVAVGLSAISFSAALRKDAAPIPNAGVLREPRVPFILHVVPYILINKV